MGIPIEGDLGQYVINQFPKPNLKLSFGDSGEMVIYQTVKKTLLNRFRYWMLCYFFPFKIEEWD